MIKPNVRRLQSSTKPAPDLDDDGSLVKADEDRKGRNCACLSVCPQAIKSWLSQWAYCKLSERSEHSSGAAGSFGPMAAGLQGGKLRSRPDADGGGVAAVQL